MSKRKTLLERIRESDGNIVDILKMIVDEIDILAEEIFKIEERTK